MCFAINRAIVPGLLLVLAACGGDQPAAGDTPSSASDEQSSAEPTTESMSDEDPAMAESGREQTFEVSLSGSDSADEDGSGTATVTLDPNSGEVCYEISVRNIDAPTAAHIHTGAAGEKGGVVVPFNAPVEQGEWQGCVSADPAAVQQIIDNPMGYYVNVHNEAHPGGAVRGQLEDAPGA